MEVVEQMYQDKLAERAKNIKEIPYEYVMKK